MGGVSAHATGFTIPAGAPVLRGSDLLKEAEGMAAETVDLGNGVVVEKRGGFRSMLGEVQMTFRAKAAAWEAAKAGAEVGRTMFETYRKTHPEEFGAAAVERERAIMSGEMPPPSPDRPGTETVDVANGQKYSADPDRAVTVAGERNVHVTGSARDDFLSVLYGSTAYGLAGNDHISGKGNATLDGGDGDDVISAGARSHLYGGAGNDLMTASDDAVIDGGDGDDRMEAADRADVSDLSGDNDIRVSSNSRVVAGDGHDRIDAVSGSDVVIDSGGGNDMVSVGGRAQVTTGAGDDMVTVGRDSSVATGTGDDILTVNGGATIAFNRGDGHDIIGGGQWGAAYSETDHLSSSVLSFGAGISPADLNLQRQGNDLLVQVGNDSVTLKDVQRHGIPTMSFADGSVLDGSHLEAMVGPAEPYRPLSQVMQRFVDASRAYRNQTQSTGTAV